MRRVWSAACLFLCACGSNTQSNAGTGGEAGASGSGGGEPPFGSHCPTSDDGSELLKDDLVGVPNGVVDASHFYYSRPGNDESTIGRFALVPDSNLETVQSTTALITHFALHAEEMWWVEGPFGAYDDFASTLQRVAKEPPGAQPEVVLDGSVSAIRANSQGLVVARPNEPGSALSARFELVPWSGTPVVPLCDYPGDAFDVNESLVAFYSYYGIATCPLVAGTATIIVNFEESVQGFAIDATHAYFRTSNALKRVPLTGGTPETITDLTESFDPRELLLEDDDVIYEDAGRVLRIPKSGGAPSELVSQQSHGISFVTTDATHVYWGDGGDYDITCVKRKAL